LVVASAEAGEASMLAPDSAEAKITAAAASLFSACTFILALALAPVLLLREHPAQNKGPGAKWSHQLGSEPPWGCPSEIAGALTFRPLFEWIVAQEPDLLD
jgi:hypothetical protein